ncbi:MAG: class I SAM-dependent methyltransferase [Thermoplasmata archaeon]|nr:class I SAM-dependent methyltransferase [Thermoplasmata archaeon]
MTFEDLYREGRPPWDIGRAQAEIVALLDSGAVVPPVLDVGCGTGEAALACALRGLEVRGVDGAPTAIALAREKAKVRGLSVPFDVADALALGSLGTTYRTVLDCGLFHVFEDEERTRYAASLFEALRPGGSAYLLCFSDAEPNWGGPRRVRADEFAPVFADRFVVADVRPATFETNLRDERVQAWRVRLDRRPYRVGTGPAAAR